MEIRSSWVVVAMAAAAVTGCAADRASRVDVGAASEAEHRALAAQHASKAQAERSKYDPRATVTKSVGSTAGEDDSPRMERDENPTRKHLRRARRERALAEAHANAARHIEAFHDTACASSPAAERAACPLITDARVEDVAGGVRIHVSTDAAGTLSRVRCHLAFARQGGYEGQDECPLYVPGTRAEPVGEEAFDVLTDRADQVEELRHRVREHVAP